MHKRSTIRALVAVAATTTMFACGGSKAPKSASATTQATSAPTTAVVHPQKATVTPADGLHNGDVVHVVATGFRPNQTGLGVVQCGNRGGTTTEGDCNIGGIAVATSDATGTVTADFKVITGSIGGNGAKCDKDHACVVSVTQLTLTPEESTATPITLA